MTGIFEEIHIRELGRRLKPGAERREIDSFERLIKRGFYGLRLYGGPKLLLVNEHTNISWPTASVEDIIEVSFGEGKMRFVTFILEADRLGRDYTMLVIELKRNEASEFERWGVLVPVDHASALKRWVVPPEPWVIGNVLTGGRGEEWVVVWQHAHHAVLWGGESRPGKFMVAHATTNPDDEATGDWSNIAPNEDVFNTFDEASAILSDCLASDARLALSKYKLTPIGDRNHVIAAVDRFYDVIYAANEFRTDQNFTRERNSLDRWVSEHFAITKVYDHAPGL